MQTKQIVLISIILFFLAIVLISPNAEAVGVGVSPATLHFSNMLRDGYAEGFITSSVGTDNFVSVSAVPRGEIAEWIDFPEGPLLQVNKDNPGRFKIVVTPPSDVANGIYNGFIRFTTSPLGEITTGAGSAVTVSVDASISVGITDTQFLKCTATGFVIKDTEEGQPLLLSINVFNEGNVRVRPEVDVTIWNQRQDKIVETFSFKADKGALPTTRETFFFNLPNKNLDIAQYWADITVRPCQDSKLLTFDIVEPGTLALDGILKTIITKVWAEVGEITQIIAVFQNIGESPVKAKFKGNVQLDGRVIQILESEQVVVGIGEEANLTTFFTPGVPGRFIVKGRVFYGNKQTFDNTGIINVAGIRINYILIAIYGLVVALLVFIIYRLYKRRMRAY